MLGTRLDYFILRSMAHRRNLASEQQLDDAFKQVSKATFQAQMPKFRKLIERFDGHLPLDPKLRYLDLGCGTGELTMAFAKLGAGGVAGMTTGAITGVDILPRSIERARKLASEVGVAEQVNFICQDVHTWFPAAEERYDVVLSFDALEHIDQPRQFLHKMADLVTPGGIAVLAFGPLFHSPFGDHMWDFFRVQIPWRGILFPEQTLLRVRREYFRPTDPARRYRDIAGGLNQMRYADFLRSVHATGWEFDFLAVNTFLKRWPALRTLSDWLMRIPGLQDYFVHNVYAVLRRPTPSPSPVNAMNEGAKP